MGKSNLFSFIFLFLTTSIILTCCDQKVDEGDDKLTEGNQSIELVYNGASQTVHFDDLETLTKFNDLPVVSLEAIILGSGLVLSTDNLWLNFVGTDDYSPLANQNCESDFVPTPGNIASKGYIERGARRLLWDEDLSVDPCVSVKDVAAIHIAEDPADLIIEEEDTGSETEEDDTQEDTEENDTQVDTNTNGANTDIEIDVNYNGTVEKIELNGLNTSNIDEMETVLLKTIFETTSFGFEISGVKMEFEGSDGYNPSENGTCEEDLPADGAMADRSGVNLENGELVWTESLGVSGCAFVKDLAIIYVTDK